MDQKAEFGFSLGKGACGYIDLKEPYPTEMSTGIYIVNGSTNPGKKASSYSHK